MTQGRRVEFAAVAQPDPQAARFDRVAEHGVVVARGRRDQPGACDIVKANGEGSIGQGIARRPEACDFGKCGLRGAGQQFDPNAQGR